MHELGYVSYIYEISFAEIQMELEYAFFSLAVHWNSRCEIDIQKYYVNEKISSDRTQQSEMRLKLLTKRKVCNPSGI